MDIHNKHGERIEYAMHEPATPNNDTLILLAHGVTGDMNRESMVSIATKLAELGWSTMRFSFAGNGGSEGDFRDATISKEVDDLGAILDQVKNNRRIVYVGYSMGGAVGALAAAKDDRINVLVNLAGMVNTKQFAETEFGDVMPDEGCMWEEEANPLSQQFMDDLRQINSVIPAVKEHRIPWLLIHGSVDDVVLPTDSEELIKHIKGKKKHLVIEGTDHSFEGHWDQIAEEINTWIS